MLIRSLRRGKGRDNESCYTFLRAIGPDHRSLRYVEPSRRPADIRYGEKLNRLFQHHQFKVVYETISRKYSKEYYLDSLLHSALIIGT